MKYVCVFLYYCTIVIYLLDIYLHVFVERKFERSAGSKFKQLLSKKASLMIYTLIIFASMLQHLYLLSDDWGQTARQKHLLSIDLASLFPFVNWRDPQ